MKGWFSRLFSGSNCRPVSRRRSYRPELEMLEERQLLSKSLFGVGGDGRVYEQKLNNLGHAYTSWSPTSSGGQIISDVSTSKDAYSGMHIFGVGNNGQVYEQDLTADGSPLAFST
jgi:hypothetical protein